MEVHRYSINQLWRTTLINSSRALRKNSLHGRIWGPEQYDNVSEEDDEDNNPLSLSSNSKFNRQRSLSTASETKGRVRDMIDTLERSSSASSSELDEEEGSGTPSARARKNSSKRDKIHQKHRSLEEQQQQHQQGRLPQRGSVNNLFGTSGSGVPEAPSQSEQEIEDKDNTITAHGKRHANGNEPRLLPFPPTGQFLGLVF